MTAVRRAAFAFALASGLAGCALAPSGDKEVASQVDPALRAAAATAEASRDYKAAAQHWRTLWNHHPDDKAVAIALARAMRLSGQGQQAADIMQMMVARGGKDADLIAEMGKDYLAADRLGLARKSLEEAAQLDPLRWDVPNALGVCDDVQGKPAEADYAAALKLSPDNPEVLNNLALSQALNGKLDEAIATLRHADDQPSAGPQVRQNLAMMLALKGDAAGAERMGGSNISAAAARANAEIYRRIAKAARQ